MGAPRELYAPLIKGQMQIRSGIGTLVADDGTVTVGSATVSGQAFITKLTKTIAYSALATSAASGTSRAFGSAIPAGAYVLGASYYLSAVFSGGTSAARIYIGDGTVTSGFLVSGNIYVGASATYHTADYVGKLLSAGMLNIASAARTPNVYIKTSGANVSALTQGSVRAEIAYVVAR